MGDNKSIKDGLGNLFTLRMRDVSQVGDGSLQQTQMFASIVPLEYGTGGMYQHCAKSGQVALVSGPGPIAQPIYAFHYPGRLSAPYLSALIRRVRMSAWSIDPFAIGWATFDITVARSYTTQDTNGLTADFTNNNQKLSTAMEVSLAHVVWASTSFLIPGARLLDTAPLDSQTVQAPTTSNTPFTAQRMTIFEKLQGEHPLFLAANEGFVVSASLPSGNKWQFVMTTEWDEVEITF